MKRVVFMYIKWSVLERFDKNELVKKKKRGR